jgi:3,4-dihydroxy-2-butanone 4-phosphate synthase
MGSEVSMADQQEREGEADMAVLARALDRPLSTAAGEQGKRTVRGNSGRSA